MSPIKTVPAATETNLSTEEFTFLVHGLRQVLFDGTTRRPTHSRHRLSDVHVATM